MARPTLFTHPKFLRLSIALGSRMAAAGALECVWRIGYESGDPFVGDARLVEYACEWRGEPGELAAALLETGFLDEADGGGLLIHDLLDHAPDYVLKRFRREAARRTNGADVRSESGQRPVNGRPLTRTPTPTPTPTPKRREREGRHAAPPTAPPSLSEVEAFWAEEGFTGKPSRFWNHWEARAWKGIARWQAEARKWAGDERVAPSTPEERAAEEWGKGRPDYQAGQPQGESEQEV